MQPDIKARRGRPVGAASHAVSARRQKGSAAEILSVAQRMADAIFIRRCDLSDTGGLHRLLRQAGFRGHDIARHADEAIATARARRRAADDRIRAIAAK